MKKAVKKFLLIFDSGEDKTDLNLLLKQLLNERSIEESLRLKTQLDERYGEIMQQELENRQKEVELISNYLKNDTRN